MPRGEGTGIHVETILEVYISEAGEYLGMNEAAREVLGYTDEELQALPLGALSGADPEVVRRFWPGFRDGTTPALSNAPGQMETRDGGVVTVLHLTTERLPDGRFVTRSVLLPEPAELRGSAWSPSVALAELRQAEQVLASMGADDIRRPAAELRVVSLRDQYRRMAGATPRRADAEGT